MSHLRFNPPPNWPPPPAGWLPPAGWQPPADWPSPPAGWDLILELADQPEPHYATTTPHPAYQTNIKYHRHRPHSDTPLYNQEDEPATTTPAPDLFTLRRLFTLVSVAALTLLAVAVFFTSSVTPYTSALLACGRALTPTDGQSTRPPITYTSVTGNEPTFTVTGTYTSTNNQTQQFSCTVNTNTTPATVTNITTSPPD